MAVELQPHVLDFNAPSDTPVAGLLTPQLAGVLAERIAHDLHVFDPDVAELELITCGALYDPVEILRPVWRLHDELDQLAARAPRKPPVAPSGETLAGGGRVIAFGASEGQMPGNLQPDWAFGRGPLLLLPIVLKGSSDVLTDVGMTFERNLLEAGMVSAETALFVQEVFGTRVEHARYLTAWDLAAMMRLQYQHAGLDVLWPVIERYALAVSPEQRSCTDTPNSMEPELIAEAEGIRLETLSEQEWLMRYRASFPSGEHTEANCRSMFLQFQGRQHQIAAILRAHSIQVHWSQLAVSTQSKK